MATVLSDINHYSGLKNSDVQPLLKKFGKNALSRGKHNGFFYAVWNIFKEPMFIMLLVASSLYFILGEANEGLLMLVAMIFVVTISIYQETKSSNALQALKQYTQTKIRVIRDYRDQNILSEELVPGDIMVLEEGNRVPADAIILQSNDLTLNESVITGESVPVDKNNGPESSLIFQGSMINSGSCMARVTLTGSRTVLGRIGKSVDTGTNAKTLLEAQIGRFVKALAGFGLLAFALIWMINYVNSKDIVQSLLLGLTLAMSAVPEEIPVAFSTFMALGAAQMARVGIITRRAQTIENLGAVSVICLDKTGTITQNKMQVKEIYAYASDQFVEADRKPGTDISRVLMYARLACEREPFDAMEKAIAEVYQASDDSEDYGKLEFIHEYPLGGRPPMMTHVYQSADGIIAGGKGAPERILKVCHLENEEVKRMEKIVLKMTSSGYRVLGVCSAVNPVKPFPAMQDDFNWKFEGFLSLYDPPRENVGDVFIKWYRAGIVINLVTGDYQETALNIASLTGIRHNGKYLTGEQVMEMPEEKLNQFTAGVNIYARMFPEAKLKLINAFKSNGQIIAMTGDGVNDAPALKSADIGIAMGKRGADLAKEASDLIITDDNLEKITEAISFGRKIYSNFKKAIRYIISIHIPIILTASLPLILGWKYPAVFTPIHVIFLELIMGPTCSIFYEREEAEPGIMDKKPRPTLQNIFSGRELTLSITQGICIAAGLLFLYYYFMGKMYSLEYVRNLVFTTIILSNILLTFANRSFSESIFTTRHYKNTLAPWVLFISCGFLLAINILPGLRDLFKLAPLSIIHYMLCLGTGLLCVGWFELFKMGTGKQDRVSVSPGDISRDIFAKEAITRLNRD
jgi:Ca2+-transporting ATPase